MAKSGAFNTLIAKLDELGEGEMRAGWFESARYESGISVAQVMAGNEYGVASRSIPPRPFMRPAVMRHGNQWMETLKNGAAMVMEGKATVAEVFGLLGLQVEGDIIESIASVHSPALSPLTLAARKRRMMGGAVTGKTFGEFARLQKDGTLDISGVSTKPLNDTGFAIASLTHIVGKTQ